MLGSNRSGLSSRAENTSGDLYGGLGLSDENGAPFLNASGVSQVGQVAGNSKAVLAALRALQDKIRRLDTERAHAIDEAAQLRQQCKALELEVEHAKQRETLSAQRTSHEARVQQERWYSEKAELEVRLARAEDRIRDLARAAAEAEASHRAVEEGRRAAEDGERRGEERARALEEQLAQAAAKEREVAQTLVWETKRHEDECEALQAHIKAQELQQHQHQQQHQQQQEQQEQQHRAKMSALDGRRAELEEAVSKLLAVNAKLTKSLTLTRARQERDAEDGGDRGQGRGGKAAGRGGGKRPHSAAQPQPHAHAYGKHTRPKTSKPPAAKAAKTSASKSIKSILAGITASLGDADARRGMGRGSDGQGGGDSEEDEDEQQQQQQQQHYFLRSSSSSSSKGGKRRASSEAERPAMYSGGGTHAHAHSQQLLRRREPRAKAPLARHAPSSAFSSPSSAAASSSNPALSSRHTSTGTGRHNSSSNNSNNNNSSSSSRVRRAAAALFNAPRCAGVTTAAAESGKVSKSTAPSALHWVPGGLRGVDSIHSSLEADAAALNTSVNSHHSHQSAHSHHSQPSRQQHQQRRRAGSIDSEVSTDSRRSLQSFRSLGSRDDGRDDGRDVARERQGERERRESPSQKAAGIALSRRPRAVPPSLASHSAAAFWDGYDVLGSEADKRGHAFQFQGKTGHTPPHGHTHAHGSSHSHSHSSASSSVLHSPPSDLPRRPSTLAVPVLGAPEGYGKARDNDLQVVIESLEEEFKSLNSQYRTLLKTVSSPARGSAEEEGFAADEKEGQLVEVIQKLHKRGEMLRKLKSPTRA